MMLYRPRKRPVRYRDKPDPKTRRMYRYRRAANQPARRMSLIYAERRRLGIA